MKESGKRRSRIERERGSIYVNANKMEKEMRKDKEEKGRKRNVEMSCTVYIRMEVNFGGEQEVAYT